LFELIKKGQFDFPSPYWDPISDMAKELIRNLLILDPTKRWDSDKILAHPWIVGEKTPRKQLPNVTNKIREFNAKRKFKVTPLPSPRNSPMSPSPPRRSKCSSK
jgi:calcium/calmodulin-dependent protein kinase I